MRTRDGLRLETIVRMLEALPGVIIRKGSKHIYIALAQGMRPCPIAASTYARTMVVPWLEQVTGYAKQAIYDSLKSGEWQC